MSVRFRKSIRLFPGVRLNLSGGRISTTIGVPGASLNLGLDGQAHVTLGIPGTGLSYRARISPPPQAPAHRVPAPRSPEPQPFRVREHGLPFDAPSQAEPLPGEIRSAAIRSLTSPNLIRLKTLVNEAADRRQSLQSTISSRRFSVGIAERRLAFAKTFIVRLFSRGRIARLEEEIETGRLEIEAAAKEMELTSIQLDFAFDGRVLRLFEELREAFNRLRRSARVWDVTTENATNRFTERTLASRAMTRTLVTFGTARTDIVKADWEALRFGNANGEDLYLYPGFVLLKERSGDFALVDIADMQIQAGAVRFHEEEGVPHDATVVGTTWKKTNKDGSPDRRFRDNYQIPIAHYGELTIQSRSGINEAYMFSNAGAAASFASAFATYQAALAATAGGVAAPSDDGVDCGAVETAFEVDADGDAPDRGPPFPVLDAVFLALLAIGAGAWFVGPRLWHDPAPVTALTAPAPMASETTVTPAALPPQGVVAASVPSPAAPAPKAVARETAEVRAQAANVRRDAGANAPVLRTARRGERFSVFSQKEDWLEIGDTQPAGWIHRSLVELPTAR
ncbi:DUF4236 domain-containing protein [Azospirillum picis]|uniref:SH3b domain-containing protein n=1 Tax=Azospirillum picis TaxID=488438 RepID=A0ABU0MT10_9PROT|nr:DUF4236 domain-containing protein [Azospirillum picis]MBP2302782.1 hypothetical protein [Azospirillum picis]MDQ0536556.1 hypothetical protein [Azospirillum picis]